MLSSFDRFLEQVSGKRVVVFLDYDGTLTPIVSNPDHAFMSPSMRGIVKDVGRTFPTAIISGRGRLKVEDFVQLDELFYAGSHGLDIKGPVVRYLHSVRGGHPVRLVHVSILLWGPRPENFVRKQPWLVSWSITVNSAEVHRASLGFASQSRARDALIMGCADSVCYWRGARGPASDARRRASCNDGRSQGRSRSRGRINSWRHRRG